MSTVRCKIFYSVLAFGLSISSAYAGNCTKDGLVCQGDNVFAYNQKLLEGKVTAVNDNDTIAVQPSGGNPGNFSRVNVASTHSGACADNRCIGGKILGNVEGGITATVEVAGVFPTGYIVARFPDGTTVSAKAGDFVRGSKADEETTSYQKALDDDLMTMESASQNSTLSGLSKAESGKVESLQSHLHVWSGPEVSKTGNPWRNCYNSHDWEEPLATDAQGNLRSDCAPDTLYTWGPAKKVAALEQEMGESNWWLQQTLFTTATPVATFNYGQYPIRIKLKKNVNFKIIRGDSTAGNPLQGDCNHMSDEQMLNTVLVRVFNDGDEVGLEYVLCSAGPIHSWSFGTRKHYDEMVRETAFILNPANQNSNPKHGADYQTYIEDPHNFHPRFFGSQIDGDAYTEAGLAKDLSRVLDLSANRAGKVYVNPDSHTQPEADLRAHFETKMPSYFHADE
jgi:hypothetical protein